MKTCLLISTYNFPQALNFCLESIFWQSTLPDEIIIADDGSCEETGLVVQQFKANSYVPVIHCWQEDHGFRLAKIRNKALALATADYIIQIDGDIIMHPKFIEDHLKMARKGVFLIGSRSMIKEKDSKKILLSQSIPPLTVLRRIGTELFNKIRCPFLMHLLCDKYKISGKYKTYTKGCNMSFWKDDFLAVNGYNEAISGWGEEDVELVVRFFKIGLYKRSIKFGAIAYHIWHPCANRDNLLKNQNIVQNSLKSKVVRCEQGVDKYIIPEEDSASDLARH